MKTKLSRQNWMVVVLAVLAFLLFAWAVWDARKTIVAAAKYGRNVLYVMYLHMTVDEGMHDFGVRPHWWNGYAWHGPVQAYCEARSSHEVSRMEDFTYAQWEAMEQKLAERWFPVGTPLDDVLNHFVAEGFSFVFKQHEDLKETDVVRLHPSEGYVRFETWSVTDDVPYLQTFIYFVFDKTDPEWTSKRIQVVHNKRQAVPMMTLLRECEMEEVDGDRERFDWSDEEHFFTEGRRLGFVSEIRDLYADIFEDVIRILWPRWFPEGTPLREIEEYLLAQGFEEQAASCCTKAGDKFRQYKLQSGGASLYLKIGVKISSGNKKTETGYFWDMYSPGGGNAPMVRRRAEIRQSLLSDIAKREGRDLYE